MGEIERKREFLSGRREKVRVRVVYTVLLRACKCYVCVEGELEREREKKKERVDGEGAEKGATRSRRAKKELNSFPRH